MSDRMVEFQLAFTARNPVWDHTKMQECILRTLYSVQLESSRGKAWMEGIFISGIEETRLK